MTLQFPFPWTEIKCLKFEKNYRFWKSEINYEPDLFRATISSKHPRYSLHFIAHYWEFYLRKKFSQPKYDATGRLDNFNEKTCSSCRVKWLLQSCAGFFFLWKICLFPPPTTTASWQGGRESLVAKVTGRHPEKIDIRHLFPAYFPPHRIMCVREFVCVCVWGGEGKSVARG